MDKRLFVVVYSMGYSNSYGATLVKAKNEEYAENIFKSWHAKEFKVEMILALDDAWMGSLETIACYDRIR